MQTELIWGDDGLPVGYPWDQGVQTIGPDVLFWAEDQLAQPDGRNAGDPWKWADDQARYLLWWYAVDEFGRWLFTAGQLVLPKGKGKSPLAAAVAICELAGPTEFGGFDENGEAYGIPYASPQVQLAAVSRDQTDNTMALVISMLEMGRAKKTIRGLDCGLSRIRTRRGKLIVVTANAASREGGRTTAAILDETHRWTRGNRGTELYRTIQGNLTKMNGRSIETTNAWMPGMASVAEMTGDSAQKEREGQTVFRTKLQWHRQAPPDTKIDDIESLRAGLEYVYAGSPWINIERVIQDIYAPDQPVERSRRMFLNQLIGHDEGLFDRSEWKECAEKENPLVPGDQITLGFDGGKNDDSTVLVALRVKDRKFFVIGLWEKPLTKDSTTDGETIKWEVDKKVVDGAVRNAKAMYDVVGFFADVEFWESYVDAWGRDFRGDLKIKAGPNDWVAWDMRGSRKESTLANERLMAAVPDKVIKHNGHAALERHVMNARRRPNEYGISFGKESRESKDKCDLWAGMLLAYMAWSKYDGSNNQRKKGSWAL
ncbi:MAG TPA: hypothetical protein VF885_12640 [Arthrobacter sp.]